MDDRSDAAAAVGAVYGEEEGAADSIIMEELMDDMNGKFNNNSSSFLVKLTPDQEQLGIPPFLVYLAGLALLLDQSNNNHAKENRFQQPTSYSVEQTQTFLKLQTLYHHGYKKKERNDDERPFLFELSPRLTPSNEMQAIIYDLVTKKRIERAEAVMKELLSLEEDDARNTIDISARTRRKKQSPRRRERENKGMSSGSIDLKHEESKPDEKNTKVTRTLEELLVSTKLSTANLLPRDDDSSWIQVGRNHKTKQASCDTPPLLRKDPLKDSASSPDHHENRNDDEGSVKQTTTIDTVTGTEVKEEMVSALLIQEAFMTASGEKDEETLSVFQEAVITQRGDVFTVVQNASTTAIEETKSAIQAKMMNHQVDCQSYHIHTTIMRDGKNDNHITTRANDNDKEAMDNLEILLQQQRQELEKVHARSLQRQREDYEERIQALQLRLFISETRLKTYEDALNQHVEAVAANISH
jgi:hypothetical protein